MIDDSFNKRSRRARRRAAALVCSLGAGLAACGGGGSNPFDSPDNVNNPTVAGGQRLAFAYFQKCIQPILTSQTCSASGCHDNVNGTGGALRLVPGATQIDLSNPANTPAAIRTSDMYKNFYSAQGSSFIGSPAQSKLLNKPLVQGVLHGGGVIFASPQHPDAKLIEYWISHPTPQSSDEFSTATYASMFNPPFDPANPGASNCNTQ